MNDFLNALPWRLAALAGLLIGAVSFFGTEVDYWNGLQRIAMAFGAFFAIGAVAQKLLLAATPPNNTLDGIGGVNPGQQNDAGRAEK